MSCFAVIDTKVLLSALLSKRPDAATVRVMNAVFDGTIIPLCHEDVLSEYKDVLSRPKFHLSASAIEGVLRFFSQFGLRLTPKASNESFPDADDRIFYEIVLEKRETDEAYLGTGNVRHFPVKRFVVTPAEMLALLEQMDAEQH